MRTRFTVSTFTIAIAALLTLLAAPAVAVESTVGTLVTWDTAKLTLDGADGQVTYQLDEDFTPPASLEKGERVVVRYDASNTVTHIVPLHDDVVVEDELIDGVFGALAGEIDAATPQAMTIATTDGKQAFVIDSAELFPPLPRPGERVAVLYRIEPATGRDKMIAYDLVTLPATDQVAVSSRPMKKTAESNETESEETRVASTTSDDTSDQAADRPAEDMTYRSTPSAETQMASLPQTASQLQWLALFGLLSLIAGVGVRFLR